MLQQHHSKQKLSTRPFGPNVETCLYLLFTGVPATVAVCVSWTISRHGTTKHLIRSCVWVQSDLLCDCCIILLEYSLRGFSLVYDFSIDFLRFANAKLLNSKHSHLLPLIINNTQQKCVNKTAKLRRKRKKNTFVRLALAAQQHHHQPQQHQKIIIDVHAKYVRGQFQMDLPSRIEMSTNRQYRNRIWF